MGQIRMSLSSKQKITGALLKKRLSPLPRNLFDLLRESELNEEGLQTKICGLEGLPGTGKSTICRMLPAEIVSDYAGSDVGSSYFPPLIPDPCGHYRITLDSLWQNNQFFTAKEMMRTKNIFNLQRLLVVLDRRWISQIIFTFAVTQFLLLPDSILRATIIDIEKKVQSGKLYFPNWLVVFQIPERTSYRKV